MERNMKKVSGRGHSNTEYNATIIVEWQQHYKKQELKGNDI